MGNRTDAAQIPIFAQWPLSGVSPTPTIISRRRLVGAAAPTVRRFFLHDAAAALSRCLSQSAVSHAVQRVESKCVESNHQAAHERSRANLSCRAEGPKTCMKDIFLRSKLMFRLMGAGHQIGRFDRWGLSRRQAGSWTVLRRRRAPVHKHAVVGCHAWRTVTSRTCGHGVHNGSPQIRAVRRV